MSDNLASLKRALELAQTQLNYRLPEQWELNHMDFQLALLVQLGTPYKHVRRIMRLKYKIITAMLNHDAAVAATYYAETKRQLDEVYTYIWKTRLEAGRPW